MLLETEFRQPRGRAPSLEYTNVSCGITSAWGLNYDPWDFVLKILGTRQPDDRQSREAFILFSDVAHEDSRGSRIAKFIKERPWLGPLVETGEKVNPNSGNVIKAYLWEPDHRACGREARSVDGRFERMTRK